MSERPTDRNRWLFSNDPNRSIYKTTDHLTKEKRNLLNKHLDGELTKDELREKLKELRDE